jgi:hypothetical protein
MLIQSCFADSENKQDPGFGSAESGKVRFLMFKEIPHDLLAIDPRGLVFSLE